MEKKLWIKKEKNGSLKIELKEELVNLLIEKAKELTGESSTFDEIETEMTKIIRVLQKEASEKFLEGKDPQRFRCKCGLEMEIKERSGRQIIGLVKYTIKRRIFFCKKCRRYEKPLDEKIGIQGRYSLASKKAIVLTGSKLPFEESSIFLHDLINLEVSDQTIQTYVEGIGQKIWEDEKKKVDKKVNSEGQIKKWIDPPKKKGAAYLMMDGAMVHTREEGWKEVRNGLLFRGNDVIKIDKHHKKIVTKRYFSVFNQKKTSLQQFKDRATQEAYDFGFHAVKYPVILGDGAPWIWEYAKQYHPDAIQILDYYHASEYLGLAFQSLNFDDIKQKKNLETLWFDWLWNGKINNIITALLDQKQTKEIQNCLRYFRNNQTRMSYKKYRKLGLQIGSGSIESAHRIIVHARMKLSGMHWKKKNVQSIVSLRAKSLSGDWPLIVQNYLLAA